MGGAGASVDTSSGDAPVPARSLLSHWWFWLLLLCCLMVAVVLVRRGRGEGGGGQGEGGYLRMGEGNNHHVMGR